MKYSLLLLGLMAIQTLWGQMNNNQERLSDEDQIINAIDNFFYGLNNADTTIIKQVSWNNTTLRTTFTDRENTPRLIEENYTEFLKSVGAPRTNKWEERISGVEIKIDDNFADAWMNYSFYVDDQFSHCGINSFQFFNTTDGWKIISIIDTRRKDDCEE